MILFGLFYIVMWVITFIVFGVEETSEVCEKKEYWVDLDLNLTVLFLIFGLLWPIMLPVFMWDKVETWYICNRIKFNCKLFKRK